MGSRVLIIDDDLEMVELVKTRLGAAGYEVITAKDGLEGLRKANQESPDLIILDIKMAQMDGYTVLQKLRREKKTKPIPVVILTAYDKMKDLFKIESGRRFLLPQ